MSKIAIVYFSGYGHTQKQAEAVAEGARAAGAEVAEYRISAEGDLPDGAMEALGGVDAIIYGSPTYMGAPPWQFKKFADASSKPWFVQAWKDKLPGGVHQLGIGQRRQVLDDQLLLHALAAARADLGRPRSDAGQQERERPRRHQLDGGHGRRAGSLALRCLARRGASARRRRDGEAARPARRSGRRPAALTLRRDIPAPHPGATAIGAAAIARPGYGQSLWAVRSPGGGVGVSVSATLRAAAFRLSGSRAVCTNSRPMLVTSRA